MESLYVGNLHPDVTESMLLEKFSSVGRVYTIHLCRDKRTGASLRYAFVSFRQQADAECAWELLHADMFLGQPMSIMWAQRDLSVRKGNEGNIFINNLEKSIDCMSLYETFSTFGNVLSCKVVCGENGSKGYGYVHFERAEAAEAAIKRLNGMLFNDRQVFITHFKSRQERQECQATNKVASKDVNSKELHVSQAQEKEERHSKPSHKFEQRVNLCVKNLDVSVDDERLHKEFSPFGSVINAKVMRSNGYSRGFGFVCFSSPEEATKAMRVMHGRMLDRKPLNITLIQCKQDRQASVSNHGTQPVQNRGLNHRQPAPPSGHIMDAGTNLQTNHEIGMGKKPRTTVMKTVSTVVPGAVPVPLKPVPVAVPTAIKTVPAAVPTTVPAAVKTVQAAVPAAVPAAAKTVPAAVPTRVPVAVRTVPAAVSSSVKTLPAVVPTTVPDAVPTAVKTVQAVVPAAVPSPVTTVQAAVPAAVKRVPAEVPTSVPTEVKTLPATTPAPVIDGQLTKDTMRGKVTGQSQDTQTAVPALSQKPLTIYMLESADVDEQIMMLHEYMLPLVEKIHPTRAKDITWMIIQGENNYNLLNIIGNPELMRSQVEQIVAMLRAREAGHEMRLPQPKSKNKKWRKKKHFQ